MNKINIRPDITNLDLIIADQPSRSNNIAGAQVALESTEQPLTKHSGMLVTAVVAILAVHISGIGIKLGTISLRAEHLLPLLALFILVRRGRCGPNLPLVAVFYVPFLWYMTVSLLGAPDVARSLQSTVTLLSASAALPCLILIGEEVGGSRILQLWVVVGSLVNGLGLALYATSIGGMQLDVITGHVVAKGLAYEANIYGSQAGALLIAALVMPAFVTKHAGAFIVLVNCGALILSQARGAWIGTAIVLVLVIIGGHRHALRRLLLLLALLAATSVVALSISQLPTWTGHREIAILSNLGTRAQSMADTSTGNGALRLRTWKLAAQDIRQFPLTGFGISSYGYLHGDFARPDQPAYLSNIYLGWLHSGGIIGALLICLSVLLYLHALGGVHAAMRNPAAYSILVLSIAYIATDGSWIAWPWALAGVALAYGRCQ